MRQRSSPSCASSRGPPASRPSTRSCSTAPGPTRARTSARASSNELKQAFGERRGGRPHRRRRARPCPAAPARGRPPGPRRRPHAADPRHLRPARRQRRGQAPGRARAARVQPAAHARDVEAPRAPGRRRRHARPGRDASSRRIAGSPAAAISVLKRRLGGLSRAARHAPEVAAPLADAHRRARRLHERRQVDAPERAHRRASVRRGPPVRDARPDDALVRRTTGAAISSPTRSASSAGCRTSSSRGSRPRSRRRSSPTSCSTSPTPPCPRNGCDEMIASVDAVLAEIGADELPVELVLNKIDAVDSLTRRRLANRYPGALQISAATGAGPRRAPRADRRTLRRPLRRRRAARPVREGRQARRALRARARRSSSARTVPTACSSAPACPSTSSAASRRSSSPRPGAAAPARRPVIELPSGRLQTDAVLPRARLSGRRRPRSCLLRARRDRPRRARGRRHRHRRRDSAGHAGLVVPRSGLAARHGIGIVNAPGLVDSGYRGELRVVARQHGPQRERSRSSRACGSHSSSSSRSRLAEPVDVDELPETERGAAGFGSSGCVTGEPRIRVSAVLRWRDSVLLCRHEKGDKGYWLLPGGGVHCGREPGAGTAPRAVTRRSGSRGEHPLRGPGRPRRLDRTRRSFARKHVVHIIFAGDLTGRSLEQVTSAGRRRPRPPAVQRSTSSTRSCSTRRSSAFSSAGSPATRSSTSGALWAR